MQLELPRSVIMIYVTNRLSSTKQCSIPVFSREQLHSQTFNVQFFFFFVVIRVTMMSLFGSASAFPPKSLQPLVEEVTELLKGRKETVSVAETVSILLLSNACICFRTASRVEDLSFRVSPQV
jgi:hypothetical protein